MKKRNLVLHTAIASAMLVMMGSASAVTSVSTTAVTYANEQFLGTTPGAATVAPTINIVTGVAIPAGSTVTIMVELSGGILGVATTASGTNLATPLADTVSSPAFAPNVTAGAGLSVNNGSTIVGATTVAPGTGTSPSAAANNANVIRVVLTNTGVGIGVGGTVATIGTATLNAAGLAVIGATVNATGTILVGTVTAPLGAAVPSAPLFDAVSTAAAVGRSAKGITLAATPNTSTAKIDLTAATPSTVFTVPTASATETGTNVLIKLGTITVTNGTAAVVASGNALYVTGGKTTIATVTAPAGFFSALGTTGLLTIRAANAIACAGAVVNTGVATSTVFGSAAAAAAATTLSTAAANLTGAVAPGTAVDVCLSVNGTTAIVSGTPVLTATLGVVAAQDFSDTLAAPVNLLALASNGQTVDVRSYVPKSVVGYTSFIRMINTGSIAGVAVSGQFINADGSVGTPFPLTTLAAGGSITMSSTDIEAIMGAPAGGVTARPRLRLTAPTNGLNVQSQLSNNATGVFTDFNGGQ